MSIYDVADRALRRRVNVLQCSADELIRMGNFYLQKKDFKRADRYFRNALMREPSNLLAYKRLAAVCVEKNDFDGAVYWLEHYRKMDPLECELYHHLAWLHCGRKDMASTHACLTTWLSFVKEDDEEISKLILHAKIMCEYIESHGGLLRAPIPVRYAFPLREYGNKPARKPRPAEESGQLSLPLFGEEPAEGRGTPAPQVAQPVAPSPKVALQRASVEVEEPEADPGLPRLSIAFIGSNKGEGFTSTFCMLFANRHKHAFQPVYVFSSYLKDVEYILAAYNPDVFLFIPFNNVIAHDDSSLPYGRFEPVYSMIRTLTGTYKKPVIAASAHIDSLPGHAERIAESGACAIFGLPFNMDEMIKTIMAHFPLPTAERK